MAYTGNKNFDKFRHFRQQDWPRPKLINFTDKYKTINFHRTNTTEKLITRERG